MSDLIKIDPFADIINQAANTNPSSNRIEKYATRINANQCKNNPSILLLDVSGSMGNTVDGAFNTKIKKIDILKKAIGDLDIDYNLTLVFCFNSTIHQCPCVADIDEPIGSTALHLALDKIAPYCPRQTLIVCDGQPDSKEQALASVEKVSGIINTLYIGSDDDTEAIAFMAQLARVGCGKSHVNDISKSPQALTENIRKLLPPL